MWFNVLKAIVTWKQISDYEKQKKGGNRGPCFRLFLR